MSAEPYDKDAQTDRFERKRERIVEAASELINELGVKGMTFADVAQKVDLNTTSVTYYFKRKELLAEAAFERSMAKIEAIVHAAGRESDTRARVSAFLRLTLEEWARIRRGDEQPNARLSDLRAMQGPILERLKKRWLGVFRDLRETLFGPALTEDEKSLRTARATVLTENVFWLQAWLNAYSVGEFPRVHHRLFEIFDRGIAIDGAQWRPRPLDLAAPGPSEADADAGPEAFLRVATRLINDVGYRGASVERIAAHLNVTKGSFYYHLDGKDDLVIACFERSYERLGRVQAAAIAQGGSGWDQIASGIAGLLEIQLFSDFPLLRTSALNVLPAGLVRQAVIQRSDRTARRIAGTMIDGITEGSIRAVDPLIASQVLMATVNNASELRQWATRMPHDQAVRYYASTVARGLFASPN